MGAGNQVMDGRPPKGRAPDNLNKRKPMYGPPQSRGILAGINLRKKKKKK